VTKVACFACYDDDEQDQHRTLVAGALVSAGLRGRRVLPDRDQRLAGGATAAVTRCSAA
jgi:hypothetical protein